MRITASEEDMVKFKPEDASLTEANMRAVLKQFKVMGMMLTETIVMLLLTKLMTMFQAGELTPHLKSEEQPEDWDANPVKVSSAFIFSTVFAIIHNHVKLIGFFLHQQHDDS